LIGDGRLARHLHHYLALVYREQPALAHDYPLMHWSRRTGDGALLEQLAATADTVLLAIRDSAIDSFVQAHPGLAGKRLVHFSGALTTPLAAGLHPLMTFGEQLYDLPLYQSIPFIGEEGRESLRTVLPFLPNPSFSIPSAERPYYHALCVLSGNFTVLLWQKLTRELRARYGIPQEATLPYLGQTARNLGHDPTTALTGPFQRGDLATIADNLRALEDDDFRGIYAAFVHACLASAAESPDLRPLLGT